MKHVLLLFFSVVAVAATASYGTLRFVERRTVVTNEVAAHEWLHRELRLTDTQRKALGPIETHFAENQRRLAGQLRAAKLKLARVMAEDKAFTPRVATEVEAVHHCLGEMQKASIEHVFKMRTVLSPEQGDKLLALAQRTLEETLSHRGPRPAAH
ncbi:MAG: periplasmic heavy metal sensor [Opitutaceae bacterium]|nr:periplasmic heavy metal sensor [Opitutaceae bacterium]